MRLLCLVGRGARLALAAGCLVGLSEAAHAQENDTSGGVMGTARMVLGFVGLAPPEAPGAEIDYRERPRLVVPPTLTLRKPQPNVAERDPNWPQDPDVARRKAAVAVARAPVPLQTNTDGVLLTKDELLKGRRDGQTTVATAGAPRECEANPACHYIIDQNRNDKAALSKSDVIVGGKEPERGYLTEPPKGYRTPQRSVTATTAAPEIEPDAANPLNFFRTKKQIDE